MMAGSPNIFPIDPDALAAGVAEVADDVAQREHAEAAQPPAVERPTVGRIVHFYTTAESRQYNGVGAGPYAAIVTQVFDGSPYINLQVFAPFSGGADEGSVLHQDEASALGALGRYWVYPPRTA